MTRRVWGLVMVVRPKQWTKNLLVFFAFFFTAGQSWALDDLPHAVELFGKVTLAFILFSAISGSVYIVNDILDAEKDRQHPRKRKRPIASGVLSPTVAWPMAVGLGLGSVALAFLLEPGFGVVASIYLVMMFAYSFGLKRVELLDVFAIAAGFVLRATAGAVVIQAPISPWLYVCTGLGALLIALAKRRSELALAGDSAVNQRDILARYTLPLLDQFIAVVAPATIVAYTLYTFTAPGLPENDSMMLTIPFVLYGLFRYLYLVHFRNLGESPEEILITDKPLIATIVLWLATAAIVLVLNR